MPTELRSLQADAVRPDMLGRGFALAAPPPFFDDNLLLRLTRRRTSMPADGKRWWKFPPRARYGCWLEQVLHDALPEEAVFLANLEFRRERANLVNEEVDGLHADGGYIRSVHTLFGLPTLYRDAGVERPVPGGQTLLMTAQDRTRARRVRCTLHRRPGAGPERAVIVCSFAPRPDQPQPPSACRQAALIRH